MLGHKHVVVEAVVNAVDVAQPSVPACPLAITDPSLGEARHLPAAKCLSEVVADATEKDGSMTRGSPNSLLAPTRTARRTYAHGRVEGATITSPFSSSKCVQLDPDTSTSARGARTLEVRKSAIPMRI